MYNSVIAAISTPPGKGGVALIRMSGEGAFLLAKKLFIPKSKRDIESYPARTEIYGDIVYGVEVLDDGMIALFPAPSSYTGEDVVELSIHGGILNTEKVLEALFKLGAKQAEAGEFTRRAFINGKLSLTDAEAIGTLLEAKSYEQLKLSGATARKRLNDRIASIRLKMRELLSSMYARIDYPDEDLGDFSNEECKKRLESILSDLTALQKTYRTGKAICEGINTVICGKPNVGKSSLYNLIFDEDLAIVTDIAGTTRDVLTGQVPLGRVMLNLSDTAGIRNESDAEAVEKIGIERAKNRISECELLICVFDASRPLSGEDEEIFRLKDSISKEAIAVVNKCDLNLKVEKEKIEAAFKNVIYISTKDGCEAKEKLSSLVNGLFTDGKITSSDEAVISTARQNARIVRAIELIESALLAFKLGITQDAASSDVELALGELGELDGRGVSEEIVSDIFSKFCVGK